jgi:hypothetical protein
MVEVPETSNFGARTVVRLTRPASPARLARLSHGEGLLCVTL